MNDNRKVEGIKGVRVFAGIDVGKEAHYLSLIEKNGMIKAAGIRIDNNREGFEGMLKLLEKAGGKEMVAVGFEPTGHYWKSAGYYLQERGYQPYLINPFHVKLSKELRDNRQRKTDKKDSQLIAHLIREGKYMNSRLLVGEYEDLRRLTIVREKIVQEMIRCQARLKAVLDEYLPEYEKCFCKLTIKTSLELLKRFGLAGLRNETRGKKIAKAIVMISRHKISAAKADTIVAMLKDGIGVKEGLSGAEVELRTWIKQIEGYQEELNNLEKQIKTVVMKTEEAKYLISIIGVGAITAAIVLGQTGSFTNYSNAKKLEKLAGLDLIENSSGNKIGQKSISKRGRDLFRYGLYRIAMVAIAKSKEIKRLYEYKINELKKKKMVAVTDITVKLLRIMFALVKNKSMYDGRLVLQAMPCS
jgi:transposase